MPCFNRQGQDSGDDGVERNDFFLGVQTEFQKEIIVKYAQKSWFVAMLLKV